MTLSLGDCVVGGLVIGIYDPGNFFSGFSYAIGYSYQISKYSSGQFTKNLESGYVYQSVKYCESHQLYLFYHKYLLPVLHSFVKCTIYGVTLG